MLNQQPIDTNTAPPTDIKETPAYLAYLVHELRESSLHILDNQGSATTTIALRHSAEINFNVCFNAIISRYPDHYTPASLLIGVHIWTENARRERNVNYGSI